MDEPEYKVKIRTDCDWIIGSFKEREIFRAAESHGLLAAFPLAEEQIQMPSPASSSWVSGERVCRSSVYFGQ